MSKTNNIPRASEEDLRSGKIQLVKPWAKKSVKALKKALSSPCNSINTKNKKVCDKCNGSGFLEKNS